MTRDTVIWLAVLLIVGALAGGIGFSAGRFSGPTEVTSSDAREWHLRKAETKKRAKTVDTKTVTTSAWLPVPDGGVLLVPVTTTETHEREDEATTTRTDDRGSEKHETKAVAMSQWSIEARAGAVFGVKPLLEMSTTGPASLTIDVCGSRRIVGGLSATACASTVGSVSGGLRVEF